MTRTQFIALCAISLVAMHIQSSGPEPGHLTPAGDANATSAVLSPAHFAPEFMGIHTLSPARHWPSVPFGAMRPAGVSWAALEPAKGQYDWRSLDFWVSQAHSHGVQLDYLFLNTPRWASTRPDEPCNGKRMGCAAPPDMSDWANFVTALVTRFKGRIASYELWNEPNASAYWSGTPQQMADMAARAYPIIKSIDPDAIVASPSASSNGWPMPHDVWLDEYLSAGGGKYSDAIAWHGYAGRNDRPALPPEDLARQIQALRIVLARHRLSQLPIWDTEGGWGKNDQLPDPGDQAAFVARWYLIQFSSGIARAYWYQWDNPDWGTLWREGAGPTPAGAAYEQIYNWLSDVTAVAPCHALPHSTLWICDLQKGNAPYRVAWSTSGQASFPAIDGVISYTEIGAAKQNPAGRPVMVGPRPILFELKPAPSTQSGSGAAR